MKKKLILVVTIMFSLYCCQNKKQADVTIGEYVTVSVVDNIKGNLDNSELSLSYFVEKIDIIPLEFTDDCILREIRKVVIHDDNIFIMEPWNRRTGKIYRFDMQGNFLNSIGSRGQGPQELIELMDFSINEDINTVYMLDNAKQMVYHFDFNGRFIERVFINQYADKLEYKNGLLYIFKDNPSVGKYLYNLIVRNIKGEIVNFYFPSKKYISSNTRTVFTKTNETLLFNQPMDPIVYSLNSDTLNFAFFFDFGSYNFTPKEIEDTYMMRQKTLDIMLENERFSDIDHLCYVGKWIHFNAIYKIIPFSFLYDTSKDEIKVVKQLFDDIELMFTGSTTFYGQTKDAFIGVYEPETSLNIHIELLSNSEYLVNRPKERKEEQLRKIRSIMRGNKQEDMNPWILLYHLKQ